MEAPKESLEKKNIFAEKYDEIRRLDGTNRQALPSYTIADVFQLQALEPKKWGLFDVECTTKNSKVRCDIAL